MAGLSHERQRKHGLLVLVAFLFFPIFPACRAGYFPWNCGLRFSANAVLPSL